MAHHAKAWAASDGAVAASRAPWRTTVRRARVSASEIGTDLSRFASVKHVTSWLGLCPRTKISGGKVLGRAATKRSVNRATQALKLAAAALRSSKSALSTFYRRMCARMDKGEAVTAFARGRSALPEDRRITGAMEAPTARRALSAPTQIGKTTTTEEKPARGAPVPNLRA